MRAFAWFLAALVLTGLISGAIGFPAYELTSSFAAWPFHRVVSRIAMLVLAASLVGVCRHLQIRSKRDFGYGLPWRRFLKLCVLWGAVGVATAGIGAAFLLLTQLRVGAPDFVPTPLNLARIVGLAVLSGISVSLLEETVFRGLLHTAVEREAGPWTAALLTAPLFAVLHFFAKVRIPADQVGWGSGFDLLLRSFAPLGAPGLVADTFLSWLVVGMLLSLTRVLTGNIAVAIGLHAGWVVVLRMLQESTVSGPSSAYSAWVGRFDGLLGYWLLPWGIVLAAGLWLTRSRWVPPARAG
jgi:membrane protease YdiL (CAAX protease family)